MDTIDARHLLDAGAASIHNNHPDALVRRTVLASVLVAAGVSRSSAAAINAFRIWATPLAKAHAPSRIFDLANARTPQNL